MTLDCKQLLIGGLIGGVACFLAIYFIFGRKYKNKLKDCLPFIPLSIVIAHAFGRVGCFFAGCCYGIETDSWLGVKFPQLENKVFYFYYMVLCSLFYTKKRTLNIPLWYIV